MLRPISLLLGLTLALMGANTLAAPSRPTILTIWTSSENVKKAIAALVPPFELAYGVKVQVDVLNKDLTTQFKTAALARKGPDILCWAHDVVGELAQSGLIEPLSLPPRLAQEFLPVALNAFTFQGRVYGYPYDLEAVALIYNTELLPQAPATFEELLAQAPRLKAKQVHAFLYDINNFFFSFPMLTAHGGYIFKQELTGLNTQDIGLANIGSLKGAHFLHDLVVKGSVPSSTDRNIAFSKMQQGQLAATIDGPWAIQDLKRHKIPYAVAPLPLLQGKRPRPFVGAHGFIIRRSSENKELAKEFIENYLVTREGIVALYQQDPRGPSRMDALDVLAQNSPELRAFMESAARGIPMPNVPEMGAIWGAMGSALSLITSQQQSPEEALQQALLQINNTLQQTAPAH